MVSLTFLGIMVLLDSMFLSNFLVIRALRRFTDAMPAQSQTNETDNNTNSSGYNGCCFSDRVESMLKAFFIGIVHSEANSQHHFPGWKQIPFRFGIVSTTTILLIMLVLLSPDVLLDRVGVVQFGKKPATLCKVDDFETQMKILDRHLNKITNIGIARKQYNYTKRFHEALLNDTTLYGTDGFECMSERGKLSGRKDDWLDQTQMPASKYGTFFPGYCGAAREYAIDAAKSQSCKKEACACVANPFGLGCVKNACADLPFPCPAHTVDEEETLENYRRAQLERAYETEFIQKLIPTNETLYAMKDTATDITDKILFQLDIAGTVYVVYSCIAMFFPSPLVLFRSPFIVNLKRMIFGVEKLSFMGATVAIWWGVEYFRNVFYTPEVQIYLQNLMRNPCFVDGEFLREREKAVNTICEGFVSMESDWTLTRTTIDHIVEESNAFVKLCNCEFPNQYLRNFVSPTTLSFEDAAQIGFGRKSHYLCTGCSANETLYLQDYKTSFLGNTTLCTDTNYARSQYMEAPESELSWWEIWIASGLLASMAVKIVMGNFGVALLRLADPFSECGGQYESPPASYKFGGTQSLAEMKEMKEYALTIIAARKTFLWGVLSNAALLNMMLSAYLEVIDDDGSIMDTGDLDFTLGVAFASLACIIPLACCCFIRKINRWETIESEVEDQRTDVPVVNEDEDTDADEFMADTDDEFTPDTDDEGDSITTNTYDVEDAVLANAQSVDVSIDKDNGMAVATKENTPQGDTDDQSMMDAYWCNTIPSTS